MSVDIELLAAGLLAGAAAFLATVKTSSKPTTKTGTIRWTTDAMSGGDWRRSSSLSSLSAAGRRENATVILDEWRSAGYPIGIALAALSNARSESDLDHTAVGDEGASVGLFQLNQAGHGAGLSVEERMDPVVNTRVIISAYRQSGGAVDEAYDDGATVAEMAYLFSRDVERAVAKGNDNARAFAKVLLPGYYNHRAREIYE